jgi:hypothetical protein
MTGGCGRLLSTEDHTHARTHTHKHTQTPLMPPLLSSSLSALVSLSLSFSLRKLQGFDHVFGCVFNAHLRVPPRPTDSQFLTRLEVTTAQRRARGRSCAVVVCGDSEAAQDIAQQVRTQVGEPHHRSQSLSRQTEDCS